jgi:hypothetical protein
MKEQRIGQARTSPFAHPKSWSMLALVGKDLRHRRSGQHSRTGKGQ